MPIHWFWIVALLVVVLIIFGPGRLPELGGAVGKAMREFRKATNELTSEVTSAASTKAEPPAPASPPSTPSTPSTSSETTSSPKT
ncbi:MAG TPA: twin-arginine translocase TatA/TatE family subunit [Candidatus Dormibacteraeota bacterium]|nr:twin-arginine translocase TatA/TatE family subunit [Candidatus Dormibacteraeota bacterium]